MRNYYHITLRDRFNHEPISLPGGFVSIHETADYLDYLVNELAGQGFEMRRLNRLVSISDLVTIEIKQTDQCNWERVTLAEEFASNKESDLRLIRKYIQESEERVEQYFQEMDEFAEAQYGV